MSELITPSLGYTKTLAEKRRDLREIDSSEQDFEQAMKQVNGYSNEIEQMLKELADDPEKGKIDQKQWTVVVLDKLSKLKNIPSREAVLDIVKKAGGNHLEFFGADHHFAPTMSLYGRDELNIARFNNGSNDVRSGMLREYANYIKDGANAKREVYAKMDLSFELSAIKVQKALNNVKINKPDEMILNELLKSGAGKIKA